MTSVTLLPDTKTGSVPEDPAQVAEAIVRRLPQIATLPEVAARVIQLASGSGVSADTLNDVISSDPSLGTRILKVANSSFYSMSEEITSLRRAIVVLGNSAVKNIALASSLTTLHRIDHPSLKCRATQLWTHAAAVAGGAALLAKRLENINSDEAFLAGLVHDVGIIVEIQAQRPAIEQAFKGFDSGEYATLREAELKCCKTTHEHLGAALCRHWGLPESLINVTGNHHDPSRLSPDSKGYTLTQLVHVADILAACRGLGATITVDSKELPSEILNELRIDEEVVTQTIEVLPEIVEEFDTLFFS